MTHRLPFGFARRFGVLWQEQGEMAVLLIRPDTPLSALSEARRQLGRGCPVHEVDAAEFAARLAACYSDGQSAAEQVAQGLDDELDLMSLAERLPPTADLLEQEGDAPIIRLINALLSEAVREKASDVHLETFEHSVSVRLRVDGQLREVLQPRRELATLLVSRIKVMARLDIAEKRLPQDGRIALRLAGHEVDVRVSTLPSAHGERVVLRLLDKQAGRLELERLGMPATTLERFRRILGKPHGILLVTGPTGSGKTTSLYAALNHLNDRTRNILTVEDPIEYHLPGIGQTPVNPKVEMTFARGLRAILRQDPDVVMVGEIRDRETAAIAVQASLTGHLVLSTLHTNSAAETLTRLHHMGVAAFNIATAINLIIAQRLARKLCPHCKKEVDIPKDTLIAEGFPESKIGSFKLYSPVGCEQCNAGYKGRVGIYEVVKSTPALERVIMEEGNSIEISEQMRKDGFNDLRTSGLMKAMQGVTSLEEINRVTKD